MAVNSLTVNYDQLRSITENKILPGLADAITKDNPVLFRLMRNSRTIDGGVNIQKIIRYANSAQGGAIALGLSELDAAEEENRTRACDSIGSLALAI
jgi:hypothetical protein